MPAKCATYSTGPPRWALASCPAAAPPAWWATLPPPGRARCSRCTWAARGAPAGPGPASGWPPSRPARQARGWRPSCVRMASRWATFRRALNTPRWAAGSPPAPRASNRHATGASSCCWPAPQSCFPVHRRTTDRCTSAPAPPPLPGRTCASGCWAPRGAWASSPRRSCASRRCRRWNSSPAYSCPRGMRPRPQCASWPRPGRACRCCAWPTGCWRATAACPPARPWAASGPPTASAACTCAMPCGRPATRWTPWRPPATGAAPAPWSMPSKPPAARPWPRTASARRPTRTCRAQALLPQRRPLCRAEPGWDDARWQAECRRYREIILRSHSIPGPLP